MTPRFPTALLRSAVTLAIGVVGILAVSWCAVRQPAMAAKNRLGVNRCATSTLRSHLAFFTQDVKPRSARRPENLDRAAAYIRTTLSAYGCAVRDETYAARGSGYRNVIAEFGPPGAHPIVVGAHYDSFGDAGANPGADDNASGVAGVLEIGRLLAGRRLSRPVWLVAWSTEEPPFYNSSLMGSAINAAALKRANNAPSAVICLEMIGYFTRKQSWPSPLLSLVFPTNGRFVAVVGRWQDRALARAVKRGINAIDSVPAYSYSGPGMAGIDASDHRSYWAHGWNAVMVSDTAFLRNPNYHTSRDSLDTLDLERMAAVVSGVANAVLQLAGAE